MERYLDEIKERVAAGARVVVLRLRRTRNPDMVCMEILEHFLHEMQAAGAPVLLSGVRQDFARAMENLRFQNWLPANQVFLEKVTDPGSSTLDAVREAYKLLGADICATCPLREEVEVEREELYYAI